MPKRKYILLAIVFLVAAASFSFCLAADSNSNSPGLTDQLINFWNAVLKPAWRDLVIWFDRDIKPWVDQQLTPQAKEHFRELVKETVGDIPGVIKDVIDKIGELFKNP